MGVFAKLFTDVAAGAAQSVANRVAQSGGGGITRKSKTDCSPCAARAKQAAIQKKINVKSWYK